MYTKKRSLSREAEAQGDLTRIKAKNTNISLGTCSFSGRKHEENKRLQCE